MIETKSSSSSDAGKLALAVDIPRQLQTALFVKFVIVGGDADGGKNAGGVVTKSLAQTPSSGAGWEESLMQAQQSVFAQELFLSLNREALKLPWTGASVAKDEINIAVRTLPTLNISLAADESHSAADTSMPITTDEHLQTVLTLATQMMLRIKHRTHKPSGLHLNKSGAGNIKPFLLLEQTVELHTSRQTIRKVGHILHDVAANVATALPEVRMVVHAHTTARRDRSGYTVHFKRTQRPDFRKSFMILINGTGVDLYPDETNPQHRRWLAASIDAILPAILKLAEM